MTGTLSYRPEETGGRQRDKSPDTRHRRLDDRYRVLPWPEDCTVVVCLHDAPYDSRFSLSSDSHRILIWRESGEAAIIPRISLKGTVPFHGRQCTMSSHSSCRTALLIEKDIERMDWPARSLNLNPIEHVWPFTRQTLGSLYLTTSNDSGASIGAARRMGSNASTTH
ncbi:hypothetical protein TNCV_2341591 [Trichonephila clavipes]|uniref:Uncharacterized protein n=1 Tax=Trichonephila clavipes TaxID=2585209 RepID=A0A8X6R0W9_TRICX|nr:hypothetical protein TNCV_2341591 [Trichonephila clavipes]